jgi:hypothetical protein
MAQHPYFTAGNGWLFVCYTNILRFLPEKSPLTIQCSTVAPEGMRQRFINGRYYIANAPADSPLAPYHYMTAATKISIDKDRRLVVLKPSSNFEEAYNSVRADAFLHLLAELHLFIYNGNAGALFRRFDLGHPGMVAGLTNFADRIYKPHVDLFSISHESILFRKSRIGRPLESLVGRGHPGPT